MSYLVGEWNQLPYTLLPSLFARSGAGLGMLAVLYIAIFVMSLGPQVTHFNIRIYLTTTPFLYSFTIEMLCEEGCSANGNDEALHSRFCNHVENKLGSYEWCLSRPELTS